MSDLERRMSALTSGNTASADKMKTLFDVADRPGGGASRTTSPDPNMKTRPDLA